MSKRDQIITMAIKGTRPGEIAAETGIALSTVYTVVSKARRNGQTIPIFPRISNTSAPAQELRFTIDHATAAILQAQAKGKGVRATSLARDLITAICEDGLFTAVLEE